MLVTKKSITKNLKTLISDEEDISAYFFGKSEKYKKGLIALLSTNKIIQTNAPVFGKLKILKEFKVSDLNHFDFVSEIKRGGIFVYLVYTANNESDLFTAIFHPVNNDANVNIFTKNIYENNPQTIPNYLKDKKYLDFITTKEGCYKITTDEILIQKLDGKNIKTVDNIKISDITDFDVYPQKIGTKGILYLECGNKTRKLKFEKTTENFGVATIMLGGTANFFTLSHISNIFKQTNIHRKVPSYMQEDENELVTEFATDSSLGVDKLGNKIFRLTDKNIFMLKLNKNGKPSPYITIPLSSVSSYRKLTRITKEHQIYGLEVDTADGKKTFWHLDYIKAIMDYLNKYVNN